MKWHGHGQKIAIERSADVILLSEVLLSNPGHKSGYSH